MSDDPNRDIWPVREGSLCIDTCRSSVDPRERHTVCKLDRYQLEDRYLRLLDEASNLKKLSNSQEDKIKRLVTKLRRFSANPRACPIALDSFEDKNKIIALQVENTKLKDKIMVLRNQLLSHTISGRSTSRNRSTLAKLSSGRISCRSESSRTNNKIPSCHCRVQTINNESNAQNSLEKIGELEAEKNQMSDRISELEKELSACSVISQDQKVAENIEYIKVWRQMKQLSDKLTATEIKNESLNVQINDLKRTLEEKTKYSEEVAKELLMEKKRVAEIDEQVLKAKGSELSLREKEERIKDLVNEMKILQQHNAELVDLTSKYGSVEVENKELKKKVNEQFEDQVLLRTTFSTEQANIAALQTSNEQLMEKLEELQKNIDSLTVQLASFQAQAEKQETSMPTQMSAKTINTILPPPMTTTTNNHERYKEIAAQVQKCNKCCETFKDVPQVDIADRVEDRRASSNKKKAVPTTQGKGDTTDRSVQTDANMKKEQGTSITTPLKEKSKASETRMAPQRVDSSSTTQTALSPEKMLKLLDEAQINPTHGSANKTIDRNDTTDEDQRHSDKKKTVQVVEEGKQATDKDTNTSEQRNKQVDDPNEIIAALFSMLKEQPHECIVENECATLYRPDSSIKCQFVKDINNNIDATLRDVTIGVTTTGCSRRKSCTIFNTTLRHERTRKKLFSGVNKYNRPFKFYKSNKCTCHHLMKCNASRDCDDCCCGATKSATLNYDQTQIHPTASSTETKNSFAKGSTSLHGNPCVPSFRNNMTRNHCAAYITRQLQDECKPFKSWEVYQPVQRNDRVSTNDGTLQEYMKHLDKCREFVNGIPVKEIVKHVRIADPMQGRNVHKQSTIEVQGTEHSCSINCPTDCIEIRSSPSGSFPLVIADGQGLLELHIISLQLSTSAKQILFQEDIGNVSLFVSWDMWNQETACTPTLSCPKLNFKSSFVYPIHDLFSFFNFVLTEFVIFRVNVYHEDNAGYMVARGKLCIKDILDYPQNKLYYIAPVNSVIPCSLAINFGQLSLWVKLSCDVEKVEAFTKKQKPQWEIAMKGVTQVKPSKVADDVPKDDLLVLKAGNSKESMYYVESKEIVVQEDKGKFTDVPSDAIREMGASLRKVPLDRDSLTVVRESEDEATQLSSDYTLRYSSGNIKSIHTDSVRWAETTEDTSNNALTSKATKIRQTARQTDRYPGQSSSMVEFNALISADEQSKTIKGSSSESIDEVTNVISEKNWTKYKQRSFITVSEIDDSEAVREADAGMHQPHEKDTISIEIVCLILLPQSSVMRNDEYHLFYIEYSFLGYCGADMETVSVRKPKPPNQKLTYNFRRKFLVDEEKHPVQNNVLRAMLNGNADPNIKFVVVCEPLPAETDIKECVEVGFANFNIREHTLGASDDVLMLPIVSLDEVEQIGLLKICISGRDTMRQYLGRRESNI